MKRKVCRLGRTLKISLILFAVFMVLQLYYLYKITQNGAESVDAHAHTSITKYGNTNYAWNELEINSSSVLYKFWNVSTVCTLEADAQHALNRAVSPSCKNDIIRTFCGYKAGVLYPAQLPRYCPHTVNKSEQYLGCFEDATRSRIFTNLVSEMNEKNSPSACISYCFRIGFGLAGLKYGYECWCGKGINTDNSRVSELRCNISCPTSNHDSLAMCGGYSTMSVYSTGLIAVASSEAVYVPATAYNVPYNGVRIVFVLTVNGRAFRQVTRLLRIIYRPHHYYYIHVDARRDYLFRELSKSVAHFSNIRMDTSRHSTIWGGASLLTMLLSAMNELLSMDDWHWDYFLNLSESDYPVKSVEELETFLTKYKGKNFLKSHGRDTMKFIRKQGLNMLFYECENRMWRLGQRQLQDGIRIDGGSDWICVSRDFIQYVVNSDPLLFGLKQFWKYSLLPAESFFHTVLQNSLYCDTVINNNLHLTNWRRKQGCKCQYKHIVDWCGCSPNDILPQDFHRLLSLQGRPIYFARKFEAAVSLTSLNLVDELIYGVSLPADLPSLGAFWLNEYHHDDIIPDVSSAWISQYSAFVYMSLEQINRNRNCEISLSSVLESTLFIENDKFVGIVVTFEAATSDNVSRGLFESLLKPVLHYKPIDVYNDVAKRLTQIQVGTDFDAKEALFRNFAGLIATDSEIAIQLSWQPGPPITTVLITVIAPDGLTADVANVNTTDSTTVSVYHPVLRQPLPPGLWTARASTVNNGKEIIVGEKSFVVVPVAGENDIVVSLLSKAWTVAGSCAVDHFSQHPADICRPPLSVCSRTSWSTQYPDPKSWIDDHSMWAWNR